MSIKISELPSASSVTSSDAIPIVQSGTTKKVTVGTMVPAVATSITSSSTNEQVAGAKAVYDSKNALSLCVGRVRTNKSITVTTAWSSGSKIVPLDDFLTNVGGDYTISSDGGIVVGSKPKVVEITAQLTPYNFPLPSSGAYDYQLVLKRKRNGTTEAITSQGTQLNQYSTSMIAFMLSTVLEVQENDTFYIAIGVGQPSKTVNSGTNASALTIKTLSEVALTPTRSLNLTKGENTGSLVGMGDRAEVTLEKEEQPEEITETKSEEVDKLESEEGSGDSR